MKTKTKTGARVQFDKLPIGLRRKILKRTKQYHISNIKGEKPIYRKEMYHYFFNQKKLNVDGMFVFSRTKEGSDFWNKIQRKFNL